MKLYHFVMLYIIVGVVLIISLDIKAKEYTLIVQDRERIDRAFDVAVDDAANSLIQADSSRGLILNKEDAKEQFYNSLYSSLGYMVAKDKQYEIQGYVPVILITSDDGYYINYSDKYTGPDGFTYYSKRWSEKFPYYYEDENFVYGFTLGDTLTMYDKNNIIDVTGAKKVHYMNYHELQTSDTYSNFRLKCSNHFALNDETYLLVRKQAIIKNLEESMAYYITYHNNIAQYYGISYQFLIPVIDNSEMARSIDNPSIVVIFQGYPYGNGLELYNRVTISGAKLSKNKVYYLEQKSWYYLYHLEDCNELKKANIVVDLTNPYYDEKDCIKKGAYACESCIIGGATVPDYIK